MHAERDMLIKEVFPELRKRCDEIDVEFSFVDLRWGITDEQVEQGEVLPVCLGEIERCRPFFVGLLGEYYGSLPRQIPPDLVVAYPWLAEPRQRSVTEIEICAVLNHPDLARRAYFYFRNPDYLATLPGPVRVAWTSTGRAAADLQALKDGIRASSLPVREYADPQALSELVLNEMWEAIAVDFPPYASEARHEDARHQVYLEQYARFYVGQKSSLQRLDEFEAGFGPPLVVRGPVGAGKSALIANWLSERARSETAGPMFVHAVGATPTAARWEALLTRFMTWARDVLKVEGKISGEDEPQELLLAFPRFLRGAAEKARMLLLVDGVSELDEREGFAPLWWLPEDLPEGVRLVLTARDDSPALAETRRRQWPELSVGPLSVGEREALVQGALKRVGRQLRKDDLARITGADQTRVPLYIRILIQELCTFGHYDRLSERIRYYLEAVSLDELYARVMRRWEEDYGADVVRQTLVFTAVSREGLLEQDLFELTKPEGGVPLTSTRLSPFLLSAELEISPRPGVLSLTNQHVGRAIRRAYLTPETEAEARASLIDYFRMPTQLAVGFTLAIADETLRKMVASVVSESEEHLSAWEGRAFRELPWQLSHAGRWEELMELVSMPLYLRWAAEYCPGEPVHWWRELSARGYRAMAAFAGRLAPQSNASPEDLERIVSLLNEVGEKDEAFRARGMLNAKYRASGAWDRLGWSLMNQGAMLRSQRNYDRACELCRDAEAAFLKAGDEVGAACARADLGVTLFDRGLSAQRVQDVFESSRLLRDSLRVLQREGKTSLLAIVYNALGSALSMLGEVEPARDYLKRAEHLFRAMGQRTEAAAALKNRGLLEVVAGRRDAAASFFRMAAQAYRDAGNATEAMNVEVALAKIL
jgi:tetratricopeptide (TPR) repeat protein